MMIVIIAENVCRMMGTPTLFANKAGPGADGTDLLKNSHISRQDMTDRFCISTIFFSFRALKTDTERAESMYI